MTPGNLTRNSGRLLWNLWRSPSRACRALARWLDAAYKLQRCADRQVPRWFSSQAQAALATIPGYSSAREVRLLAYLAAQAPAGGCVVEIGAYKGRSTAWLVEAAQFRRDRPAVISIDPHLADSWPTFQDVVRRVHLRERGLEVHRAFSRDIGKAWTRPISMLWVDGGHTYEDVADDIALFTPHVIAGGWVVFDDAHG